MQKSSLIEPGVKYFLHETLKNYNKQKIKNKTKLFNVICFLSFFSILGIFLYYKFKTRPTRKDLEEKERLKKNYILSKIKSLNTKVAKERQELITNLPNFESDYELMHKKF
tara:strand:+ start:4142 stop:4474 length:333 start_codon:yes stop_codon:yes gene_type:complete